MNRDERSSSSPPPPSLSSLLQQYTTRTGEREVLWKEGTRACREQQKVQTTEIERLRQTVNQLQAKANVSSESGATGSRAQDDRTNLNYKTKYDEAEARCRQWETRFRQLESNTIKPLQDKVDQLQRDYQHMKSVKDRIAEICSARQLTNRQLEQLKSLVMSNPSEPLTIETIANKNDFHQQTIKLRDILLTENNNLLLRMEEMLNRKRKRNEEPSSDDEQHIRR